MSNGTVVGELENEVARLRSLLQSKDDEINRLKTMLNVDEAQRASEEEGGGRLAVTAGLTKEEVARYGRQLILPQIGAEGQGRLKAASVLIVGAGGLGCPAAIYLAAAGVGRLGIVDYDAVETSNLHRQIMHSESSVGVSKALSLANAVKSLNSLTAVDAHCVQFNADNAPSLVADYDAVLDCSDNPATRYLVNDACVIANRPLVSASALRWEGQLTVYHYGDDGPCYRCLYPTPPDAKFVTNCSDGGVIGAVPGLMGTLQALETIKLLLPGVGPSLSGRLLLVDGETAQFRTVSLRKRQPDCAACSGAIASVRQVDYEAFCGRAANDKEERLNVLPERDRVTASEFQQRLATGGTGGVLLIDVRPKVEASICSLPGSVNLPFEAFDRSSGTDEFLAVVRNRLDSEPQSPLEVFAVCRRGNNSQLAVQRMRAVLPSDWPVVVKDIVGGLRSWSLQVDPQFPIY